MHDRTKDAPRQVPHGELKVVGRSGQISIGKRYAGKTFELQSLEDGTIVLRAVAIVPETQIWTVQEPHRSWIARGLDWAARNAPRESDPERLLTGRR